MSYLFSIIIPVFKVEDTIEKCARSLFEQTLNKEIEFIFVDDASPDKSIEILENVIKDFPELENQIKIISHTKNLGLPDARLTGWKNSTGEYIANCDSDDWFDLNAFELIKNIIVEKNPDIISFDWYMEFPSDTRISKFNSNYTKKETLHSLLNPSSKAISMSLWGRVIRKKIIISNDLHAKRGMTAYEDLVVVFQSYYFSKSHFHIQKPLYHYNQTNISSMSNSNSLRKIESSIIGIMLIDKFLNDRTDYDFDHEMRLMKLNVKMPFISDLKFYDISRWNSLWPNLKYSDYPSAWLKLSLYLVSKNLFKLNRVYIKSIKKVIKLYRNLFSIKRTT